MGLRTLVLAVFLLALVAYVSSAPAPSDSSESKSHDASESNSKSHSDESTSTSAERHDHNSKKHHHKREVTSPAVPEHTTVAEHTTPAEHKDVVTLAAHRETTSAATSPKAVEHGFEFYPLQAYFP